MAVTSHPTDRKKETALSFVSSRAHKAHQTENEPLTTKRRRTVMRVVNAIYNAMQAGATEEEIGKVDIDARLSVRSITQE